MKQKLLKSLLALAVTTIILLPATSQAITMSDRTLGVGNQAENYTVVEPIDDDPTYATYDAGCDGTRHLHWHTNTSVDTSTREYWGVVHSFAIELGDDFLENVDTTTLLCTDGNVTYRSCGFDKDNDLGEVIYETSSNWDGVTVTYQELDWVEGSPVGLVWEYGTSDPDNLYLKPALPSVYSDENNATKYEGISFYAEDYTQVRSATTKSWTKMEFFYIDNEGNINHTYTSDVQAAGPSNVDPDGDYIYWYGWNARLLSRFQICESGCANLDWSAVNSRGVNRVIGVDDVFANVDLSLNAYDTDGANITDDLEFHYESFSYGSSHGDTPDSYGEYDYGRWNVLNGGNDFTNSDSDVEYTMSMPGDSLYVEAVGFEDVCYATLSFPYCADLDIDYPDPFDTIIDPNVEVSGGLLLIHDDVYETNIDISVEASNGENWPFEVNYSSTDSAATFDGNRSPYVTRDRSVDYESENSATVDVAIAEGDVAGVCFDDFTYTIIPTVTGIPACLTLTITVPTNDPVSGTVMEAGNVQITWTTVNTDGSVPTGPWTVYSTNPAGQFYDSPGGALLGTNRITTPLTTVYYSGAAGDTIYVVDPADPHCQDHFTSEAAEAVYACEEITTGDPYFTDATTVCVDYTINVEDAAYSNALFLETNNPSLTTSLTVNELGIDDTAGAIFSYGVLTGYEQYTGTACVQNVVDGIVDGDSFNLYMMGEEDTCSYTYTYEEVVTVPACSYLQLSPDGLTIAATATTAGTINLSTTVGGTDSTWNGNLIFRSTGSGQLLYYDGTASSDGTLTIPVSGTSNTVLAYYVNGAPGDVVTAYVEGEETLCSDSFTITQASADIVCEYLDMTPNSYVMAADELEAGTIDISINVTGSSSDWTGTLIITDTGVGRLVDADGNITTGSLSIPVSGTSTTVTAAYIGGREGDTVRAYIQGEESDCADLFTLTKETVEEEIACYDLSFEYAATAIADGESFDTFINLNSDLDDQTLVIEYDGCDGAILLDTGLATYYDEDELTLKNIDGSARYNVTFSDFCADADVSMHIEADGDVDDCQDDIDLDVIELGEFSKYIFTFNFVSEHSAYSDENIFFSHDEDRAFYTLEYRPGGEERTITFTDDMWTSDLTGVMGSTGSGSGGEVHLATTYDELISGKAAGDNYVYKTITKFGFGESHELHSTVMYNHVEDNYSLGNFLTFVPYIKYDNGQESQPIYECDYNTNEDGDRVLDDEDVCFDPDLTPEDDGEVVIENVDALPDDTVIRVRYVGVVDSELDCSSTDDECLVEIFENVAQVEVHESIAPLETSAKLVVLCSYLVTRNAGDVFLEVDLQAGSDISCIFTEDDEDISSNYRNVDALIILEGTDGDTSSDALYGSSYSGYTASFCDDTGDSAVGNLSSYICEIISSVQSIWSSDTIESTTEGRVAGAIRNAQTAQTPETNVFTTWDQLKNTLRNQNNPNSGILYFDGDMSNTGTITIGQAGSTMTVPDGAWTLIVEGAQLNIAGNIGYAPTTSFANIPSVAFVVLGGDIYIEKAARSLVGVYYTNQGFDGDERSAVTDDLTIYGSIYGNIQKLLNAAKYVGSPNLDGGGIVVRYDSRILLNTPPALSEYVDINTEKAVN